MQNIKDQIKVLVKKKGTNGRKRTLESKLEVDSKLFQGTDWLESLGRIPSLDLFIKEAIQEAVVDYLKSAEDQLKADNKRPDSPEKKTSQSENPLQ